MSLLILPVFASAAAAQSDGVFDAIVNGEVQPDGSLLVRLEDGSSIVVPEGQYAITADGLFMVQAEALASITAAGAGAGTGALAALGGLVAAGAAGGLGGGSDAATSATTSGFVVDGYISGATVFRDEDGDGILDDNEARTTTDEQGAFTDLGGDVNAPIVSVGGTDISTGLAFEGTLKAPAGSTVISPITTLVQQIVENDETNTTTVDDAIEQVNTALGLEADTDLLNEDPITSEDPDLFVAGAKVVNIVNIGVAAGADEEEIIAQLAEEITEAAAATTPPGNLLSDSDTVQDVIAGAFEGDPDTPSTAEIEAVATTATTANTTVDNAVSNAGADTTTEDVVEAVAPVQQVVQNEVAKDIEEQSNSVDGITGVDQDAIDDAVEAAPDVTDGAVSFGAGFSEDFSGVLEVSNPTDVNSPITNNPEQVGHGFWEIDRYAPSGFEAVDGGEIADGSFEGERVLRMTTASREEIREQNLLSDNAFREHQGRQFEVPDGTTVMSIDLYIDPTWGNSAGTAGEFVRHAGFWGVGVDANGEKFYPELEFSTLDGVSAFRGFIGGGSSVDSDFWVEVLVPDESYYGTFQTLTITINDEGSVIYQVGDVTHDPIAMNASDPDGPAELESFTDVILQGFSFTAETGSPEVDTFSTGRDAYNIYWDNFSTDGAFIERDTDLSDFDQVNFADIPYDVAPGVELTLTMAQADGLQIGGSGTVKLIGAFDAAFDLTGIKVPIDATEVTGLDMTFSAEAANGLQIDVAADAVLNITVDYADLSADNPALSPEIDLSGITVNGSSSPVGLFDVLNAGSVEDTFKLLWNQADNSYYDAFPGGSPEVNAANVELGNIYAQYLLDGGEPLLDIVQTKVSGNPDFEVRQQSLHDNLLGNITDVAINARVPNELAEDNRDAAGLQFGDRPIYSGTLTNTDDLLATQVWDVANGIPRSDFTVGDGEIYVLNGGTVVDADSDADGIQPFTDFSDALAAADAGAYVVVGSGTFTENASVYIEGSITIFAEDGATLVGGLRVESGSAESVVDISGLDIDVTGTNYGIYLNGTDLTLNLTNVDIDGGGSGTSRGIINQTDAQTTINVSAGSLANLQSGMYLNPGAKLTVDGTEFIGNTAAIGTDDPDSLSVVNATFDGNGEAIGISGDHENSNVTLTNNQYVQETDQVLVYFAREDGEAAPVAIPGEWSNVTIVQSSDPDNNKAQLATITGTDGNDVIVDNNLETTLDIGSGGTDFILLTDDTAVTDATVNVDDVDVEVSTFDEGFNLILGFTAAGADDLTGGVDIIAFNPAGDIASKLAGDGFETVAQDGSIGPQTGFVVLTDFSIEELEYGDVLDEIVDPLQDVGLGLGDEVNSQLLNIARNIASDDIDGGLLMAVPSDGGTDTIIVGVDFGDDAGPEDDILVPLAFLQDVAANDLTADNFYDFSAVTANT